MDSIVIHQASNLAFLLSENLEKASQFDWRNLAQQIEKIPSSANFRSIYNCLQDAIFELEKSTKNRPSAKGLHFCLENIRQAKKLATELFLQYKEVSQKHRLEAIKIVLFCGILENFESPDFMEKSLQRAMNLLYADADLSRLMDGGFSPELQQFENDLKIVARAVFCAVKTRRQPESRVLTTDTPSVNDLLSQCAKFMHTNAWLDVGGRLVKLFEHTRGCTPLIGGKVLLKTIEHTYKAVDVVTEEIWPTRNLIQTGVDCYGVRTLDNTLYAHEGYAVAKKRIVQVSGRMEIEILGRFDAPGNFKLDNEPWGEDFLIINENLVGLRAGRTLAILDTANESWKMFDKIFERMRFPQIRCGRLLPSREIEIAVTWSDREHNKHLSVMTLGDAKKTSRRDVILSDHAADTYERCVFTQMGELVCVKRERRRKYWELGILTSENQDFRWYRGVKISVFPTDISEFPTDICEVDGALCIGVRLSADF